MAAPVKRVAGIAVALTGVYLLGKRFPAGGCLPYDGTGTPFARPGFSPAHGVPPPRRTDECRDTGTGAVPARVPALRSSAHACSFRLPGSAVSGRVACRRVGQRLAASPGVSSSPQGRGSLMPATTGLPPRRRRRRRTAFGSTAGAALLLAVLAGSGLGVGATTASAAGGCDQPDPALQVSVSAGGDIQSAIDKVADAGGGCVNLAAGTWTPAVPADADRRRAQRQRNRHRAAGTHHGVRLRLDHADRF